MISEYTIYSGKFFNGHQAHEIGHKSQFFLAFAEHGITQAFAWLHPAAGQAPRTWMFGIVTHKVEIPARGHSVKPNAYCIYNTRLHVPPG
jgi:hypothetical protein